MSSGKISSPANQIKVNPTDRLVFIKNLDGPKEWRFIADLPFLIYGRIRYARRDDLFANCPLFRQLCSMSFVFYNDDSRILFKNIKT